MVLLSKCKTIDTTCVDYVHPWTKSCFDASYSLFFDAFQEAFRIYATAYTVALVMRGRRPKKKDLQRTLKGILRSTIFLSVHAVGYSTTLCLLRRLLGNFNFLSVSFLPSFLSSIVAILVEKPSRRSLLSLYVTNVASETLFRMAVWRKWIKPVPYGDALIFALSISSLIYSYRHKYPHDALHLVAKFLIGPYEGNSHLRENSERSRRNIVDTDECTSFKGIYGLYGEYLKKLKSLHSHPSCPHPHSCGFYAIQGVPKCFAVGYVLQLARRLFTQLPKVIKNKRLLLSIMTEGLTFRLGISLSLFSLLYRGVACVLRQKKGADADIIPFPAGIIASLSFLFYRDDTIALYIMWKSFQIFYNRGVENGYLMNFSGANVFFHALSTAILFHCAILEPQNIRPSYWKFLVGMSGGRVCKMDRECIDNFGLDSSTSLAQVMARSEKKYK